MTDNPSSIVWFGPNGNQITSGVVTTLPMSVLILTDLNTSDAGEYTCQSTLNGVVQEAVEDVMVISESILCTCTCIISVW